MMERKIAFTATLIASLLAPTAPRFARAGDAVPDSGSAPQEAVRTTPDLTGMWRLDPKRSDSMQRPGNDAAPDGGNARGGRGRGERGGWGEGGGGAGSERGGWGGRGGADHGERGAGGERRGAGGAGGGNRPVRLPELMHLTEIESLVSFEDSTGKVIQEITTIGAAKDTLVHASGVPVLAGEWKDGALQITRSTPFGTMTQTLALADDGNSLVIQTKMQFEGSDAREFKRVYRREAE